MATIGRDLPNVRALYEIEWTLDNYSTLGFQAKARAARNEIERAIRDLG
jgi:hypothetical protein